MKNENNIAVIKLTNRGDNSLWAQQTEIQHQLLSFLQTKMDDVPVSRDPVFFTAI